MLTDVQLAEEFTQLDQTLVLKCVADTANMILMGVNICSEIERVMKETSGVISWNCLAQFVASGEDKVQSVGLTALRPRRSQGLSSTA